jgi:glucose/arabinose dehydrogenase
MGLSTPSSLGGQRAARPRLRWVKLLILALALGGLALLYTQLFPNEPPVNDQYAFVKVAEGFTRPLYLTHTGDERLFIVEQRGKIWILEDGQTLPDPFLDMEALVDDSDNESGLLSMAFDPAYAQNGYFYVSYTALPDLTSTIARYQVRTDDPNRADPTSAQMILQIAQPYGNHNGGLIKFGPDGYLYIGMGDGGSHNDPNGYGQSLNTLLGKLLRLDVRTLPYAIPPDNPFVDDPTARPEIWAYGLRNPWRWSFDRATGDLYIADVGQNNIEEVNFQAAASSGGANYGWRAYEGNVLLHPASKDANITYTAPIHAYEHEEIIPLVQSNVLRLAHCSVTGGYVYRGATLPDLVGHYLYGDFCSGTLWTLQRAGDEWQNDLFMTTELVISSFGEDVHGELYLMDFSDGAIWRLQANPNP